MDFLERDARKVTSGHPLLSLHGSPLHLAIVCRIGLQIGYQPPLHIAPIKQAKMNVTLIMSIIES